jgi:hypothetical protein
MDRRTALETLGLDGETDAARLKQRFRVLARDLHPDRGGDPAAFRALTSAYELLRTELDGTSALTRPLVARGRPSRSDDATMALLQLDELALDVHGKRLAQHIGSAGSCRYVSRAPGSVLNRLARSLALGTPSSLTVTLRADLGTGTGTVPVAAAVAHVRLSGQARAARRALARLDLTTVGGPPWSRHRGDAITSLEAELRPPDAHRVAAAVTLLLTALRWPMSEWSPDR